MAKKFNEHKKQELNVKRMICMCKIHKKRICHCLCENDKDNEIRIWGNFDQLADMGFFTTEEIMEATNDYSEK